MGQLGDGTNDDSTEPVAVTGDHTFTRDLPPAGTSRARSTTPARRGAGATTATRSARQRRQRRGRRRREPDRAGRRCWATTPSPSSPPGSSTCARLTDAGEAWCWGAYPSGQLGNDSGEEPDPAGRGRPRTTSSPRSPPRARAPVGSTRTARRGAGATTPSGSSATGRSATPPSRCRQLRSAPSPSRRSRSAAPTPAGSTPTVPRWCWGGTRRARSATGRPTNGSCRPRSTVTTPSPPSTPASSTPAPSTRTGQAGAGAHNAFDQLGDGSGEDALEPVAVTGGLVVRRAGRRARSTPAASASTASPSAGVRTAPVGSATAPSIRSLEPTPVAEAT